MDEGWLVRHLSLHINLRFWQFWVFSVIQLQILRLTCFWATWLCVGGNSGILMRSAAWQSNFAFNRWRIWGECLKTLPWYICWGWNEREKQTHFRTTRPGALHWLCVPLISRRHLVEANQTLEVSPRCRLGMGRGWPSGGMRWRRGIRQSTDQLSAAHRWTCNQIWIRQSTLAGKVGCNLAIWS